MKLALGTAQFGLDYGIANTEGQVTAEAAVKILARAREAGIDTIDTAIAYGQSEQRLGEAGVEGWQIVSKLPAIPDGCGDIQAWVTSNVDESLARLKVPNLRGLLLHRPEQLLSINGRELYQALLQLKEAGKVQKIGISVYGPESLAGLVPLYQFDIVQAPLNLVDRRLHSSGWLSRLKDYDIEVHTRSAFLQGLLLMSQVAISTRFGQWSYLWDRWGKWLAAHDRTAVHACMAYPLSLPEIDRVVVGADSVSQLSEILLAASSDRCHEFPDLQCDAESLINPARWPIS